MGDFWSVCGPSRWWLVRCWSVCSAPWRIVAYRLTLAGLPSSRYVFPMRAAKWWTSRAVGRVEQETGSDLRVSAVGSVSGPSEVAKTCRHAACGRPSDRTWRGVPVCWEHELRGVLAWREGREVAA